MNCDWDKIEENCEEIFLSPIFKTGKNKNYLDAIKFNLQTLDVKKDIIALGGINSNNLKVERKIKELFYRDRARVQVTKISQFGLMEISRQRIGQSIYETFYNKCDCCGGGGFQKTKSILIHNIITYIKGINAIGIKDNIEIKIDQNFYEENSHEIENKIKKLQIPFKVKFTFDSLPREIFEFNHELINKVKNNNKEIIEQNKREVINQDKSYRRKIKKKIS